MQLYWACIVAGCLKHFVPENSKCSNALQQLVCFSIEERGVDKASCHVGTGLWEGEGEGTGTGQGLAGVYR